MNDFNLEYINQIDSYLIKEVVKNWKEQDMTTIMKKKEKVNQKIDL